MTGNIGKNRILPYGLCWRMIVWFGIKYGQFSPPTRFGEKYKNTIVGAKKIHLYTYANVTDITANENVSSIKEITVKNYSGKEHKVKARYFILACCSIQNARILLASNRQASKGLGNDNDNVGRYFMEHPYIKSAELWLVKSMPLKFYKFNYGVTKVRAELAIKAKKQEEFKLLNGACSLTPLALAKNMKPWIESWSQDDPRKNQSSIDAASQEVNLIKMPPPESNLNRAFQLFSRLEQAPNPSSRITLDTEKDSLGMPRAILHWEITSFEKRSIRKMNEIIGQQVGLAGIGRVKLLDYLQDENDNSWPSFTGGTWHHMGTTRMSDDPKKGVVDANCKVHGIANLFIAGASCYATSASPNPTLTLIALSLRLSDHIKTLM